MQHTTDSQAAHTPPSLHLQELSWPQVGAAIEAGYRTAIFAVGATEQHGPQLPLLVDAEIGTDLAHRVAVKLGSTLVAPTIRVGCSEHHMRFAGTLTVREETLEALVTDYCTSLERHGFNEILLIPSHGGNFAPLQSMLPRLRAALDGATRVEAFHDLEGLVACWRRAIDAAGGPSENVGGHADIAESSILLTLTPHLVDESKAEAGYKGDTTAETFRRILADGLHTVTPNGILGDARGMTAELGERCQEAASELIQASFRRD